MKMLIAERQSGKTTTLLNLMADNPRLVMVCVNYRTAKAAHEYSRVIGLDLDEDRFVAVGGIQNAIKRDVDFVVDEMDTILSVLLGHKKVEVVSWSPPTINSLAFVGGPAMAETIRRGVDGGVTVS